tara:strand:+ start:245 stop:715 length:471 start_codon:yes stop_codon:yes gene_type:complete
MSEGFVEADAAIRCLDLQLQVIHDVLDEFPEETIWVRPAVGVSSLGNVVCHVAGSLRDWLENGLAEGAWVRDRQFEFDRHDGPDRVGLHGLLNDTRTHCQQFLAAVSADNWDDGRQFRNRTLSVRELLWHQVAHVSYHAGQASLLRRWSGGLPARA